MTVYMFTGAGENHGELDNLLLLLDSKNRDNAKKISSRMFGSDAPVVELLQHEACGQWRLYSRKTKGKQVWALGLEVNLKLVAESGLLSEFQALHSPKPVLIFDSLGEAWSRWVRS